jgi:hypothetical protein
MSSSCNGGGVSLWRSYAEPRSGTSCSGAAKRQFLNDRDSVSGVGGRSATEGYSHARASLPGAGGDAFPLDFFERFRREVGVAPMEYLLGWRMALAKDLLRREKVSAARGLPLRAGRFFDQRGHGVRMGHHHDV